MSSIRSLTEHLSKLTDARYRRQYFQSRYPLASVRERRSAALVAKLPRFEGPATPLVERAVREVRENGISLVSEVVSPNLIAGLFRYFITKPVRDPFRPDLGEFIPPRDIPPGTHLAAFTQKDIAAAPGLFELINHPELLAAAARVLGGKPTISNIPVIWSLPANDALAFGEENFHRDLDDWRFVKFFVYLTDVTGECAPCVFIEKSHTSDELPALRTYSEAEVRNVFDASAERQIVGPAGTAFLANTFGLHRLGPAARAPSMILSVTYGLGVGPDGPKVPLCTIGQGGIAQDLDPYINRVYCRPAKRPATIVN